MSGMYPLEANGRSGNGALPVNMPGGGGPGAPPPTGYAPAIPPHATPAGSLPGMHGGSGGGGQSSTYIPAAQMAGGSMAGPVTAPPGQTTTIAAPSGPQPSGSGSGGFNRNPLLCLMCNQTFQNPCLLSCYHTFCAACLRNRAVDGKLACPLCG